MRGVAAILAGLLLCPPSPAVGVAAAAAATAAAQEPLPGFAPGDQAAQRRHESRLRRLLEQETRRPSDIEVLTRLEGSDWPEQEIAISGPPELTRALTRLSRKGWKPRRTLLDALRHDLHLAQRLQGAAGGELIARALRAVAG